MNANAVFTIARWDETTFSEMPDGSKLSRASVSKSYSGDIQGEGTLEYLMTYYTDGSAQFTGLERVIGKIGERQGSFVLRHNGTFEDGRMLQITSVVENSATDDLDGLSGDIQMEAEHQAEYPFILSYTLP